MMKSLWFIIAGMGVGVVFTVLLQTCGGRGGGQAPRLAGQELPTGSLKIDFEGEVDVYLKPYTATSNQPRVIERCRIMGVVGDEVSVGGSYKGYRYFDEWVCLRLKDGRKMYTPLSDIEFFIECAPKSETENTDT